MDPQNPTPTTPPENGDDGGVVQPEPPMPPEPPTELQVPAPEEPAVPPAPAEGGDAPMPPVDPPVAS